MSKKRPVKRGKKRRTRQHIIADRSVNYVERFILMQGHSVERVVHDYGIDLLMFTYNELGEIENGHVEFQLKATDRIKVRQESSVVSVAVDMADVKFWDGEPWPVILVVYDAVGEGRAFWVYVQSYLGKRENLIHLDDSDQDTLTIHVPMENRLDEEAIKRFLGFRDRILAQVKGVIAHDS